MDIKEAIERVEKMKHHCELCLSEIEEFECNKEECDKDNCAIQIIIDALKRR